MMFYRLPVVRQCSLAVAELAFVSLQDIAAVHSVLSAVFPNAPHDGSTPRCTPNGPAPPETVLSGSMSVSMHKVSGINHVWCV